MKRETDVGQSATSINEAALLLVSRKLAVGYALALHGLEVDVDDAERLIHLRPRSEAAAAVVAAYDADFPVRRGSSEAERAAIKQLREAPDA